MKKVITILLSVVLLVLSLPGCSSKKGPPEDVSEQMYELGVAAMEICDDFLDGNIDEAEAKEKIQEYLDDAERYNNNKLAELGVSSYYGINYQYYKDSLVQGRISSLYHDFSLREIAGTPTKERITEDRNELAQDLNKKIRPSE